MCCRRIVVTLMRFHCVCYQTGLFPSLRCSGLCWDLQQEGPELVLLALWTQPEYEEAEMSAGSLLQSHLKNPVFSIFRHYFSSSLSHSGG